METQLNTPTSIPLDYSPAIKVELDVHDELVATIESRKFKLLLSPRAVEILDTLVEQKKLEEVYRDRIVHVLHYYFKYITLPPNRYGVFIYRKDVEAIFGPNCDEIYPYFFRSHFEDVDPLDMVLGNLRYEIHGKFVNHRKEYPVSRFGAELQRLIYEDMRAMRHIKKKKRMKQLYLR